MEFRRKKALDSPPGLLCLLETEHRRKRKALLQLSDRASIFRRLLIGNPSPRASARRQPQFSPLSRREWRSNRVSESVSWRKHLFPPESKSLALPTTLSDEEHEDIREEQEIQEQQKQEPHAKSEQSLELEPSPIQATAIVALNSTDEGPTWKKLLNKAQGRDKTIGDIVSQIKLEESLLKVFKERRAALEILKEPSEKKKPVAFTPLTEEEEEEVRQALNGANRHQVLVQHVRSNIDLTGAAIQCLKPGAWLNDDVINLYLELLKERELREPNAFMKCHYFNTFFFNKLYKDAQSYDYKAVRRWTTSKKLGYSLLDCHKIFVPIHRDVHWCLAVINVHEKKIQYFDSLKGRDDNVLHVLARYLKDEAKDKLNQVLDLSSWELNCPEDIPEQLNGCDCGMFMLKYADFFSRGNELKFSQKDMDYFRKKTILELIQLKAR